MFRFYLHLRSVHIDVAIGGDSEAPLDEEAPLLDEAEAPTANDDDPYIEVDFRGLECHHLVFEEMAESVLEDEEQ